MKSFKLLLVMALGFTLSTGSVYANAPDKASEVSSETPIITVDEILPSNFTSSPKSYDNYESVVGDLGSNLKPITPEEIVKANEVGYIEVNSPEELAALLEYDKIKITKMQESNSILEKEINLISSNENSEQLAKISPLADRSSYSQNFELASWGNPLTQMSYLYGRTQIYYWQDTKKIDQTNVSSYMVGDISAHEWVPSDPEIVADGYYHRYVRFLGDLKKFIMVNGRPAYTESIRISQLTQVYSTNVIGK